MPVAVVDIGTNTTRLLVAEVEGGDVVELERRTVITSLGQGVDSSGRLAQEAMDRVAEAIAVYREVIDRLGAERVVALATSAMRDAENGPEFRAYLKQRFGIAPQTISGDEEARLTFLGATSSRNDDHQTLVIDIGGGSTEYVVGHPGKDPDFHTSTQMGSVRFTERFEDLEEMGAAVREAVPDVSAEQGIAVAGTATSLAAIDDADPIHGYRLSLATCERLVAMLAAMSLEERRQVKGLHPDRAPTIVAGAVILTESMRVLGLAEIEVSERDILHGAALDAS
jgi:exopolyphosphatase / guanosine-5'-triphosphate,3'-diphosphate pyrophosphatase